MFPPFVIYVIFKLQMKWKLINQPSVYSLADSLPHSSFCILLLYPIWSLSPGFILPQKLPKRKLKSSSSTSSPFIGSFLPLLTGKRVGEICFFLKTTKTKLQDCVEILLPVKSDLDEINFDYFSLVVYIKYRNKI